MGSRQLDAAEVRKATTADTIRASAVTDARDGVDQEESPM
jgi:hypothetical protein